MVGREIRFEDTCEITGLKNGIVVVGEIINFKEKGVIVATINRAAKVSLHWQEQAGQYVGSLAGVEFTSAGPKSTTYRTHR
jgi:hypothetical protein